MHCGHADNVGCRNNDCHKSEVSCKELFLVGKGVHCKEHCNHQKEIYCKSACGFKGVFNGECVEELPCYHNAKKRHTFRCNKGQGESFAKGRAQASALQLLLFLNQTQIFNIVYHNFLSRVICPRFQCFPFSFVLFPCPLSRRRVLCEIQVRDGQRLCGQSG